jgi:hypothetical protein
MRLGRFGRSRKLSALAVGAAGLAGVVVPLAAQATPSAATCATKNLRIDIVGGQGFAGHREWYMALRNVSTSPCELQGFPAVALLDGRAAREPVRVVRHGTSGGPVVLVPWQQAYFDFVFTTAGPCGQDHFSAYGLSVTPPGATGRLVYYAARFDVCSVSRGGHPTVTAVSSQLQP